MHTLVQEESVRGSKSNSEDDALAEWRRVKDEQDIEYQQAQLFDQAKVSNCTTYLEHLPSDSIVLM